ncbi:MAG: hypothetical protein E7C44_04590 [Paeniclostridium sordellii]|nr:hypothetical protein [Paeniclostridium sordellii]
MSSKYVNNGQAGAIGDNASASNFSFGVQEKSKDTLTKDDLGALNELINKISECNDKDIKKSEMMNASLIIQQLVESIQEENKEEEKESINKWKSFISKAGPATLNFISMASTSIDMIDKLKNILGIS